MQTSKLIGFSEVCKIFVVGISFFTKFAFSIHTENGNGFSKALLLLHTSYQNTLATSCIVFKYLGMMLYKLAICKYAFDLYQEKLLKCFREMVDAHENIFENVR